MVQIQFIITLMKTVWGWLNSTKDSESHFHNKANTKAVCCSDFCKQADRYICSDSECIQKHRGHLTMQIKQYRMVSNEVEKQIKYRQNIEETIREYYKKILEELTNIFEKQTVLILKQIDKHFFSKQFSEIYEKYKNNQEYISHLIVYQTGPGMELSETIRKKVMEKQKYISQFCKQFITGEGIRLDERILPQREQIREIIELSKMEKIKALIPFQCELIPRYTASAFKFSTRTLHSKAIRGPIIVVAQSYKNRTFGGYSPKMFPKEEVYQEDIRCTSFLFSLDDRIRIPLKEEYKKFAIKGGDNLWFGRGDLAISNECHKANISWSELGRAYEVPRAAVGKEDHWLAGAKYFRILQYQIYQVETTFHKV